MNYDCMERTCKKCGEKKPTEEFYKHKTWGFRNICKLCCRKQQVIYQNNNRELHRRRQSQYYYKNKEAINQKTKLRNKFRDKIKYNEYMKLYRKANKSILLPIRKRYNSKYRQNMTDSYIIHSFIQRKGISASTIKQYPELIKTYRTILKLKRLTKNYEDEKCN